MSLRRSLATTADVVVVVLGFGVNGIHQENFRDRKMAVKAIHKNDGNAGWTEESGRACDVSMAASVSVTDPASSSARVGFVPFFEFDWFHFVMERTLRSSTQWMFFKDRIPMIMDSFMEPLGNCFDCRMDFESSAHSASFFRDSFNFSLHIPSGFL